jgi:BRCT domain type II-containing protein
MQNMQNLQNLQNMQNMHAMQMPTMQSPMDIIMPYDYHTANQTVNQSMNQSMNQFMNPSGPDQNTTHMTNQHKTYHTTHTADSSRTKLKKRRTDGHSSNRMLPMSDLSLPSIQSSGPIEPINEDPFNNLLQSTDAMNHDEDNKDNKGSKRRKLSQQGQRFGMYV